jgi:hypothetical protein
VLPAKQRVLLATLLLQANKTVSADTLIAELWDDKPTAAARNTLHDRVWLRSQPIITVRRGNRSARPDSVSPPTNRGTLLAAKVTAASSAEWVCR